MRTMSASTLILATLALAACGGGGGYEAPPATPAGNVVPPSATASVASFVNYVGTLPASEGADPVELQQLAPPTSESDDPQPVT